MIAFHASHEQFAPSDLLQFAILAGNAGFQAIHSSDHFHPWSRRQGHSGFSFAWLGAAMQATTVPFGLICAPGPRYHPAIIAQACATLLQMFPQRLWLSLGSGEALNEVITGNRWPDKHNRNAYLVESAAAIRRLFTGEEVSFKSHVEVHKARLYTLPAEPPLLLGAALSAETASLHGCWADGLLTTAHTADEAAKIIKAFRNNGGAGKPVYFKFQLSYARQKTDALEGAYDQWRNNLLPPDVLGSLRYVEDFDKAGERISRQDIERSLVVSDDLSVFEKKIRDFQAAGCDHIILHNVNRLQREFIDDFGAYVLGRFNTADRQ
jgi:probable non-F420 flavinoid oxidoreductase